MSVLWSFGLGVAFVLVCLIISATAESDSLVPQRRELPTGLRVIADRGALLPRRVPMASLPEEPPETKHVRPTHWPRETLRDKISSEFGTLLFLICVAGAALVVETRNLTRRYVNDIALWVMSPTMSTGFNEWWEETWINERKRTYHGRRRYDEVSRRTEWRSRWAEYDTQNWPTLATSGNAWDLVPTLSPMSEKALIICTGMTFNTTTQVMPVEHVARNLSENPRLLHSMV